MKLQARLNTKAVEYSTNSKAHLVVSVSAPEVFPDESRPKLCILPVLDVSGSMIGDKLDYAKKSLKKLFEHLSPGDVTGLIVFGSHVKVAVPLQVVQLKHRILELSQKLATLKF